jgi:DNA-directed RNA polymerase III subunit RPC8
MFVLTDILDKIRIPPGLLGVGTVQAIHNEIDQKFPNRVLMDVGLVVCRYGSVSKVGHGVCIAGDGGSHHECAFRLVVFRPFVEEVCLGKILRSTAQGIQVSTGFFEEIFIPAYWMLRPSRYDEKSGLWVWTPKYDDDDDEGEGEGEEVEGEQEEGAAVGSTEVKTEDGVIDTTSEGDAAAVATNGDLDENGDAPAEDADGDAENENEYEMEIGAEIRFKVKSMNFTQVTNTAKGMQATTTTTSQTPTFSGGKKARSGSADDAAEGGPIRRRSSSVGLDEHQALPASMHIVASICEDGLGCTAWWASPEEEDEEEEDQEQEQANGEDAVVDETEEIVSNGI